MPVQKIEDEIYQGDSTTTWLIGRKDAQGAQIDVADHTCRIVVADTLIDRVVALLTVDSKFFVCELMPSETATLQPDTVYLVAIQLDKADIARPYRREFHIELRVRSQAVP